MRLFIALSALVLIVACSGDADDEEPEPVDVMATFEPDGDTAPPTYIGGRLSLGDDCLQLEDETGFASVPAFSTAGDPVLDDEGLTFDGRDYELDSDIGLNASFHSEEDDVEVAVPDGCPDDADVVLVHAGG